ncbi:MAG TPA: hypothetical protein VMZ28_18380 [Kofleriaceae bacterium]|nr:hypothetical protein [Kofleriaceae bacterium]
MTRALLLLALAAHAGCLESRAVVCAGGRVCPEGTVCSDGGDACLLPEQVDACLAPELEDGDSCDIRGEPLGYCASGDCVRQVCGDALVTGNERCDPGDPGSLASTCDLEGFYTGGDVTCTDDCRYDVALCSGYCGDGDTNGPELCDGVPPPESCIEFGYDAGFLDCNEACAAELAGCRLVGLKRSALPTVGVITRITGTGPDDVWVLSDEPGQVMHFDGDWSAETVPLGEVEAIWIAAPGDVWIAGHDDELDEDTVVRRVDGAWEEQPLPGPLPFGDVALAGTSAEDLYVFGEETSWHRTAAGWSEVSALAGVGAPTSAWALAPDDVYLTSAQDGLYHRGTGGWAQLDPGCSFPLLVAGSGPDDVYVSCLVGGADPGARRWDGESWNDVALDAQPVDLWGTAPDDLYVVDTLRFRHWDGVDWRILEVGQYSALWGTAPDRVLVGGPQGYFARFEDGVWRSTGYVSPGATVTAAGLSMPSPDLLFVLEQDPFGILPHSYVRSADMVGATWDPPIAETSSQVIDAIWAADDSTVFAIVGEAVRLYVGTDGDIDKELDLGVFLHGVTGRAIDDVLAFGNDGAIFHLDDASGFDWEAERAPVTGDPSWRAIWYPASGSAFAVGTRGAIARRLADGTWTDEESPTGVELRAVWGDGAGTVWAVGDDGVILRRTAADGWTLLPAFTALDLMAITGTSKGELFAGGAGGAAFHWDGVRWNPLRLPESVGAVTSMVVRKGLLYVTGGPPGAVVRLARSRDWLIE